MKKLFDYIDHYDDFENLISAIDVSGDTDEAMNDDDFIMYFEAPELQYDEYYVIDCERIACVNCGSVDEWFSVDEFIRCFLNYYDEFKLEEDE